MKIESAEYLEDGSILASIDGKNWTVADDPEERLRKAITEWEESGNTISPYVPDPLFVDSQSAIAAMNEWIETFLREQFTGWMPDQEIASLGDRGRAAINYVAGTANEIEQKLMETGATKRGMDPIDYCNNVILPRAIPYAEVIAITAELRSKYAALLSSADPSEIMAILATAQAEAVTEAAEISLPPRS